MLRRVAVALGLVVSALALSSVPALAYSAGETGYDISWPQCGGSLPGSQYAIAIVGVTGGRAFTHNGCLASEVTWAKHASSPYGLYLNVNAPVGSTASKGLTGPAGTCRRTDKLCVSYNYGWNTASDAWAYAAAQGASSTSWWLDVETTNSWTSNLAANDRVIQGALEFLAARQVTAGVYSTNYQWGVIAGSAYKPGAPVWYATVDTDPTIAAGHYCSATYAFTGAPSVSLVQYSAGSFDGDVACG